MSRKTLLGLALLGIGMVVAVRLRERSAHELPAYLAPAAPDPAPEDLQRLDDEAPLPGPPEDSLRSFYDELANETSDGLRGR